MFFSRLCVLFLILAMAASATAAPIDIGSLLELLVDDYLIEKLSGDARLELHHPAPQNVVFHTDRPWEGNSVFYMTTFRDGDVYRMYYFTNNCLYTKEGTKSTKHSYCYAQSKDGIQWTRPNLGLFEREGSKDNNIVWEGKLAVNFAPFRDENPNCAPDARYKSMCAVKTGPGGFDQALVPCKSPDGIHWSPMSDKPVITKGTFDSMNLAFWDSDRGEYREYHRDFKNVIRDIRTSTSKDFVHWTESKFLGYQPNNSVHLYTNMIVPYYRAPHILLGFPTRYIDRGWTKAAEALPQLDHRRIRAITEQREGTAVTDGMFMSSRDRDNFNIWPESFIRPGLRNKDGWFYGDNYQGWGLVETKSPIPGTPDEISIYINEGVSQNHPGCVRRYTLRVDGFVSLSAPMSGGELITKPLTFKGSRLMLNYSTSAAGSIRIEIQDEAGKPIPGFTLDDAPELYGDSLVQAALWKDGSKLKQLSGKPVRLRFVLKDADIYSFRFQ
ncbi:MAG: hypothetical protein JXM70_29110 [Pirellulales bacterium]|nr:hypothetical protein [Pirellulales bacterium]